MNNNEECKIVDDLLPMYVDNLTNEVTNEFLENHLSKCPNCKQKLLDMKSDLDIELNQIDTDVEINGLKKIKRRTRLLIASCIIGITLLCSICIWFNNNYRFYTNDEGKLALYKLKAGQTYSNCSYIIIKGKKYVDVRKSKNRYIDITTIIALDSTDKCISVKEIINGYTEEVLNEYSTHNPHLFNSIKIKDNVLYHYSNIYIGKDKNFTISQISNYYDEIEYIKNY